MPEFSLARTFRNRGLLLQTGSQFSNSAAFLPHNIQCGNPHIFFAYAKILLNTYISFVIIKEIVALGGIPLKVSYKKLFKLMIDREIKKGELAKMASLSSNSISKLAKDENVSLDVLIRVCTALNVDFGDIMEVVPDDK